MPSCELCGRNMRGRGRDVTIEGASMLVCPQCATKFGGVSPESGQRVRSASSRRTPVWVRGPDRQSSERSHGPSTRTGSRPKTQPRRAVKLEDMILIEDYASLIRNARQKVGMSHEELAQRIGERISTLQSIEAGRLKPTGKTIRGLERELGVSLLEPISPVPIRAHRDRSGSGATLGDVVRIKRKKRKDD